ncbi:MAG TPA: hypothetical protein VN732_09900 [Solirubrobacterales bacterium]|nr:hypothetical protein [Solirubrobacterales bacterium]
MAAPHPHPLEDPVAEGGRIVDAAAARSLPLRALGGVAVGMRCPSGRRPPLAREYGDIDLATEAKARGQVIDFMESLGYAGDREFNMLHGHRRLYFYDERNRRQVDVFVNEAHLCHRIDFRPRLEADSRTLSLADLTVLKLQVVETNEKDYLDLCALFADHELTEDDSGINVSYIASLTASDWGLWRTLTSVAERSEQFALDLPGFEPREVVSERLHELRVQLDRSPKTRSWKLRSRIGERKRWYELPEEVH